ncbi:tautomerase family protein [Xanthobacter autotrophicus]|uniref:tautomerase family protein n=1 Tax=Xanthobacter TaxID=279 RepID=UPI0024AC3D5E|nr:tautomerase family protein [Xanthobacter autotrophicus]MDI4665639.1 tautomerase family protein [Xanthobacter autotrophicus]
MGEDIVPIVTFHLADGIDTERAEQLLERASALYCEVLRAPADRVRAFIVSYPAAHAAVAGVPLSRGGVPAPYFEFLVLVGRPLEERHRLASGFTDLLVELTETPRTQVRGACRQIAPEDWFIAGTAAATIRADEIRARTIAP